MCNTNTLVFDMTEIKYKHIFIDLDKTLWDFDSNAMETFREIFEKYNLISRGVSSLDDFFKVYSKHNEMLWDLYRKNQIKKEVLNVKRFEITLEDFNIRDLELAVKMAEDYIRLSPLKNNLFPHSKEALEYLKSRYKLHIITNGFEEVQQKKLDVSDLRKYFKTITTSEEAGVKKPEPGIFRLALDKALARAEESLMIGDDVKVDLEGARLAGIDQMLFNPGGIDHQDEITYEISGWEEIGKLL